MKLQLKFIMDPGRLALPLEKALTSACSWSDSWGAYSTRTVSVGNW